MSAPGGIEKVVKDAADAAYEAGYGRGWQKGYDVGWHEAQKMEAALQEALERRGE